MATARKLVVYVSSTYIDLKGHRAVLKTELERGGYDVESMERYSAFDERPLDRCLADVASCDGYVLLLAHRYGFTPEVDGARTLSITEREYEHARQMGRPCFVFCVDERHNRLRALTGRLVNWRGQRRLVAFRKRVAEEHGLRTFTDPDNLTMQVLSALSSHRWRAERSEFPSESDLARIRSMASGLFEGARISWKMPPFVAPLNLDAHEEAQGKEARPTTAAELAVAVEAGASLVLFGKGGIGKTTFLLELSSSCMNGGNHRIPLYIDAAIWARSNSNILDYIANTAPAQLNRVTSPELAKLAEAGFLAIMVNGWNEIPATQKLFCREAFIQLTAAAGALSVVVASRTQNDVASLPSAKRIEVTGLTWRGQSAVIRAELDDHAATYLLALLAKNTRLRHAARSPLILRGLVAQAKNSVTASSSVYDLLGAVVQAFEESDQRDRKSVV